MKHFTVGNNKNVFFKNKELLKKFDFVQTWKYNTKLHDTNKRKIGLHFLSRANFWIGWRFHGMFRINGQKEHLDENNFRHCYGNSLRVLFLITIMFNVLSKQLWGILTTTYERHFPVKDLNIMKQKLAKMPSKSSFSPKYKPVLQISLHQNQKQNLAFHWLLYTFFSFKQI